MSYNEHDKWAWQFSHAHTKVALVRERPLHSLDLQIKCLNDQMRIWLQIIIHFVRAVLEMFIAEVSYYLENLKLDGVIGIPFLTYGLE